MQLSVTPRSRATLLTWLVGPVPKTHGRAASAQRRVLFCARERPRDIGLTHMAAGDDRPPATPTQGDAELDRHGPSRGQAHRFLPLPPLPPRVSRRIRKGEEPPLLSSRSHSGIFATPTGIEAGLKNAGKLEEKAADAIGAPGASCETARVVTAPSGTARAVPVDSRSSASDDAKPADVEAELGREIERLRARLARRRPLRLIK
jgi:hypothetical protein